MPVYFVSKISGFTCFSIKQSGYSVSFYGYLYPVCFLLFFCVSAYNEISTSHKMDNDLLYSAMETIQTFEAILNTLVICIIEMLYTNKVSIITLQTGSVKTRDNRDITTH